MDAPKLNPQDTLKQSYPKLNQAIDNANEALTKSNTAIADSAEALSNSENTQQQLDTIVIEGDSSVEAAQARVDSDNNTFATLKERLDTKEDSFTAQLATMMTQTEFDSWVATLLDGGPSIFMETLNQLVATYPNGAAGVALVRETDPSHIYVWNTIEGYWEDFGAYQGLESKDGSITPVKTTFQQINLSSVTWEKDYYISRISGGKINYVDAIKPFYASSSIPFPYEDIEFVLKTCTTSDNSGLAFYDENGFYIAGIQTGASTTLLTETKFTPPKGNKTIRFTCRGESNLGLVSISVNSNALTVTDKLTKSKLDDLTNKAEIITDISEQLYSYTLPEETIFNNMNLFNASRSDVAIDKTNKIVTINTVTTASTGVMFTLTGLYESLKKHGRILFKFKGKTTHKGTLSVQIYPMKNATGNFNLAYATKTITGTGALQEFEFSVDLTWEDIVAFFTANSYNLEELTRFNIYLRATTVGADFNCVISTLEFSKDLIIDQFNTDLSSIKQRVKTLEEGGTGSTVNTDVVVGTNEMPLDIIKKDGGLFPIIDEWAYIGDSLSSGEHEYTKEDNSTGYIDLYTYSYGQIIARATGTKAINLSSGGKTAGTWLEQHGDAAFNTPANKAKGYVIYLGTNDLAESKNPYGMGDVSTDIDLNDWRNNGLTFAGRYATIIQRIKELQPKARIFCCTLPNSPGNTTDRLTNPIIRQIVDMFDFVYLLDLHEYAETIPNNYRIGGHLTTMGYTMFAWHVMSYIDYLIRKYPMEFKEVAFIGTDYHHVSVIN